MLNFSLGAFTLKHPGNWLRTLYMIMVYMTLQFTLVHLLHIKVLQIHGYYHKDLGSKNHPNFILNTLIHTISFF